MALKTAVSFGISVNFDQKYPGFDGFNGFTILTTPIVCCGLVIDKRGGALRLGSPPDTARQTQADFAALIALIRLKSVMLCDLVGIWYKTVKTFTQIGEIKALGDVQVGFCVC